MSTKTFELGPDEVIVRKTINVRHGRWSTYTGDLVLTNRALIYVNRGLLGAYKGYVRFDLDELKQVLVGKAVDGSYQLEVYHTEGEDDFSFKDKGKHETKAWEKDLNQRLTNYRKRSQDDDKHSALHSDDASGFDIATCASVAGSVVKGIGKSLSRFINSNKNERDDEANGS